MERFNQIIRLLVENAALLFILPVIAMFTLWFLIKDQPRKYEVRSKFMYHFGGESTNVDGESLSLQEIYTEFLNTVEIIKSRKLSEKIKAQIALESLTDSSRVFPYEWPKEQNPEIKQILQNILNDKRTPYLSDSPVEQEIKAFYDAKELTTEKIIDAISATRVQSSNFLQIVMTYTHPEEVYYLMTVLNKLLIKELENINKRNITNQKAVIEELVAKAKKELDEKIHELEELKVKNNIINLDEHTKAIVTYQVNLEQLRAKIKQEIAATNKAKQTLRSGIDNNQFASVNKDINSELLEKKKEVFAAQETKFSHQEKTIDYSKLLAQQHEVYSNYLNVKESLEELRKNAVFDPTMVHTGMTIQYIDFTIKSDQLEDQLVELDKEINRVRLYAAYFAPFESAISTLHDEISTAQKSYLLFLNKLNMTESMEVGASKSNLELVDYPEYPAKALPSKTKLIILAGGVAVFLLLSAFILINFLIDNRIMDVATFERRVGKKVIAALPSLTLDKKDPILTEALSMIENESLKKIARAAGNNKVIAINYLSAHDKSDKLANQLIKYWHNEKVAVIHTFEDLDKIKNDIATKREAYDRLLCLSNPLQFSCDGIHVAHLADCSFLHFNLGRIKTTADDRILQEYYTDVQNNQGFILSELLPEYMDTYYGEVPKQRNLVRKLFKKLLNRDFSWN